MFSSNFLLAKTVYKLDKPKSSIHFTAKTSLFSVNGKFDDFDIQVLNQNKIILKIKTASINTDNKKRDAHLKNKDFFHVSKYPEIIFKSDKIKKTKNLNYLVTGVLKIKNKSHKLSFPAEIYELEDQKKTYKAVGKLEISRKKFGVDYETSFPMPSIKDQVKINFEALFKQK